MSLFSKKTESFLGVDIGAGGIKLVELKKAKGRPQLWTYAILDEILDIHVTEKKPSPKQPSNIGSDNNKNKDDKSKAGLADLTDPRIEKYANLLKSVVAKAKVSSKRATASLPVSYVFHAMVTLPEVPDKEIDHHVRAKVKKMLPHPIEEMQVVHQKIPTQVQKLPDGRVSKSKDIKVLVTAAPRSIVSFYTAIFQRAGLQLDELETEAFALERSLIGRDKTTAMVVDIGAERTNFFIIDQGIPVTHRSLQVGGNTFNTLLRESLGVEEAMVGQVKKDISLIPPDKIPMGIFETPISPIIKEIQYSFDLFLSQSGNEQKRPEKIILTGGSSVFPPFAKLIGDAFQMKVFVGDPWARTVYQQGLKTLLDKIGPRMSVSIGLALRNIV